MRIFDVLFVSGLIILLYAYFFYPLLIFFLSEMFKKPHQRKEWYPGVTLVIPFFNEEQVIEEKLQNVKEIEYPQERFQVLFVSDGSTDSSPVRIKKQKDGMIQLIEFSEHRGKAEAINEGVARAKGEIVVFSDASGLMNKGSVKNLVKSFTDEKVGAVLGIYRVVNEKASVLDQAKEKYWDFELFLKKRESRIWSTLGGHGALYAVRKSLFTPLEKSVINDDFIVPAKVSLLGYRAVYEEGSLLFDRISTTVGQEIKRRIRIDFGNWQQIILLGKDIIRRGGFLSWQFISHKVLRAVQGLLLGFMTLCSVFLRGPMYDVFLFLTGVVVFGAGLGLLSTHFKFLKAMKVFNLFLLLFLGVGAQIIGTVRFFLGKRIVW